MDDVLKGKIMPEESDAFPSHNDTTDENDSSSRFHTFMVMHEDKLPQPKEYIDFMNSDEGKSTLPF